MYTFFLFRSYMQLSPSMVCNELDFCPNIICITPVCRHTITATCHSVMICIPTGVSHSTILPKLVFISLSIYSDVCFISLQIFGLLRIPMNRPSVGMPLFQMSDLADKRYESIRYIFQLCYRVIQHSQKGYRKNQVTVM